MFISNAFQGGIRVAAIAALVMGSWSSGHACVLSESSYSVSQNSSESGVSFAAFGGSTEGGLVQALDLGNGNWAHMFDRDNTLTLASRIALNVTQVGYMLSFNRAIDESPSALSMDRARGSAVYVITDMVRASHTFQSGVQDAEAYNLQAGQLDNVTSDSEGSGNLVSIKLSK